MTGCAVSQKECWTNIRDIAGVTDQVDITGVTNIRAITGVTGQIDISGVTNIRVITSATDKTDITSIKDTRNLRDITYIYISSRACPYSAIDPYVKIIFPSWIQPTVTNDGSHTCLDR